VTGGANATLATALGFGRGPGDELMRRCRGCWASVADREQNQTGGGGKPLWQDPVGWAVDQYSQAAGLR